MIDSMLEQIPESVVRAMQHSEARRGVPAGNSPLAAPPPTMSVALSREAGAGASEVAAELQRRLGWEVYDHQLLERIARAMKVRVGLLESVDERHVNWLQEMMQMLSAGRAGTESSYVAHLTETLLALAAHGQCIIVGRGAALVLPDSSTLRVRLVAPLKYRITQLGRKQGLSREAARRFVETTDRERTKFLKDHFHKDAAAADNYDLVLNTARFSPPACAELIIAALDRLQTAKRHQPALLAQGA